MNRRNPRKSSVRKKLRDLRERGAIASAYPEGVSVVGVPSAEFDPDAETAEDAPDDGQGGDAGEDDRRPPRVETVLETGERTLYLDGEGVDVHSTDTAECSTDGCSNPSLADLSTCEKCAGVPEQDWREGVE